MQFHFEIVRSIFGNFFILDSKQGLHFILKFNDKKVKEIIKHYNPNKGLFNKSISNLFKNLTLGKKNFSKIKIKFLYGTILQKIVWKKLLKIKYGTIISYSDLALQTPYPNAIRAVASAVGKNPISVIVPCHRVVRKDGFLGNYAWGAKMKKKLLDLEVCGMADSIYRGGK
tara:strand:+ start:342 stop:854 length:513 start_codon:yes stop_codon:yes gene_type:complete